jgi:hypothetical protein
VLALANLISLDAMVTGTAVSIRVANTSSGPLRWAPPGGPANEVPAGATFEMTLAGAADVGRLQVIAGDDVATTLTLVVCAGASGRHLLAQAIVGG